MNTSVPQRGRPPGARVTAHAPDRFASHEIITSDYRKERAWEILYLLRSNKWLLLGTFVLVVGSTALYLAYAPADYEAFAVLMVRDTGAAARLNMVAEPSVREHNLQNEISLLQESYPIAMGVANRLLALKSDPESGRALTVLYDDEGEVLKANAIALRLRREYVTIEPLGPRVDMIRVASRSSQPDEAAIIANTFADEYIAKTLDMSRSRLSTSRRFLERQEKTLGEELKAVETDLEGYMRRHNAVALDAKATNTVTQMAELEAARDQVRVDIEMLNGELETKRQRLAQVEPRLAEALASNVETELLRVQEEIARREVAIEQVLLRHPEYGDEPTVNPDLQRLRNEMATLKAKAQDLSEAHVEQVLAVSSTGSPAMENGLSYVGRLREEIVQGRIATSGLRAKEKALEERLGGYQTMMQSMPAHTIELAQLERTRLAKERLYLALVQRLQEVRVDEESEEGYAEIVRPAFAPALPVGPRAPHLLLLSTVFAALLGFGFISARKLFDSRVHQPDDIVRRGQHVIGVIPHLLESRNGRSRDRNETEFLDRKVSPCLTMLLDPASPSADAWRRLRTTIQFSQVGRTLQTLLVTSPAPGEGKSVVVANLGIALAMAGKRTVIVDADLRRPRMHHLFGVARGPGLFQLASEPHFFNAEFFSTGIENLYVIPAGSTIPNPSELMASRERRELIERLCRAYDIVLIDAPPVLIHSEAALLAAESDGTIMVARAGQTEGRSIDMAVGLVQDVGGVIVGHVLNGLKQKTSAYGYHFSEEELAYERERELLLPPSRHEEISPSISISGFTPV